MFVLLFMFVTVDRYLLGLMQQQLKSPAKSNPTPATDLDPIPVRDIYPHTGIVRDIFKLELFSSFSMLMCFVSLSF